MRLLLFRKKYRMRRYGPQTFSNGYASQVPKDFTADLDVQPDGNSLEAPAEGSKTVTRLSAWGSVPLTAANQKHGVKGDRLFWDGNWYECTSCVNWDGTPLCHYKSTFTICPEEVNKT